MVVVAYWGCVCILNAYCVVCRYVILDVLGAGTFGQVVKCKNIKTQQIVAVKVVKNKTAYSKQSMMEVAILEMVRESTHVKIKSIDMCLVEQSI